MTFIVQLFFQPIRDRVHYKSKDQLFDFHDTHFNQPAVAY